jgi:beta-amylase
MLFRIMIDVWWGIVERNGPKQYDWHGYQQLLSIVKQNGLKMQCVMSFRMCFLFPTHNIFRV